MTDRTETLARAIMDRIERDGCVHLSSIMEEIAISVLKQKMQSSVNRIVRENIEISPGAVTQSVEETIAYFKTKEALEFWSGQLTPERGKS